MALIATQDITKAGAAMTYTAAAAAGDTFTNGPDIAVHVLNANISVSRTLTIAVVNTPLSTAESEDITISNMVLTITAYAATGQLGTWFTVPATHTAAGNIVTMTYDDETDLTVAIVRKPNK